MADQNMSLFVIKALEEAAHVLRSTPSCRNTTGTLQQELPGPSSSKELRGDLSMSLLPTPRKNETGLVSCLLALHMHAT